MFKEQLTSLDHTLTSGRNHQPGVLLIGQHGGDGQFDLPCKTEVQQAQHHWCHLVRVWHLIICHSNHLGHTRRVVGLVNSRPGTPDMIQHLAVACMGNEIKWPLSPDGNGGIKARGVVCSHDRLPFCVWQVDTKVPDLERGSGDSKQDGWLPVHQSFWVLAVEGPYHAATNQDFRFDTGCWAAVSAVIAATRSIEVLITAAIAIARIRVDIKRATGNICMAEGHAWVKYVPLLAATIAPA